MPSSSSPNSTIQSNTHGMLDNSIKSFDTYTNENVRKSIKILLPVLFLYYFFMIFGHYFFLPPGIRTTMIIISLLSSSIYGGLFFFLKRYSIHDKWIHPFAALILVIVYLNCFTHLMLTHDPKQTTNIGLAMIGAGIFFLSSIWLWIVLLSGLGLWMMIVFNLSVGESWVHYGFFLGTSTLLAFLIQTIRLHSFREIFSHFNQLNNTKDHLTQRTEQLETTQVELENQIEEKKRMENLLRQFVYNTPIPVAMLDREMKYLLYSKRWAWDFHLLDRDLTGLNHCDVFPADSKRWENVIRQGLEGNKEQCKEERFFLEENKEDWLRWEMLPWRDGHGQIGGVLIMAEIITERKRTELELRESEKRFRVLADSAPVLIWMADTNKQHDYFNKFWLEFTGRTMEQESGNGWIDGIHPDDCEYCLHNYEQAFAAREPFSIVYRLRRHDGEYRWILDNGSPRLLPDGTFVGYIGSCLDITERKRMEERLAEMNLHLKAVMDSATQVSIIATDTKGLITVFNSGAERMLGYSAEEMIGKKTPEVFHLAEEIEEHGRKLEKRVGYPVHGFDVFVEHARRGSYEEMEWTYVRKNGKHINVVLAVTALRDRNETIYGFLGVATNITALKRVELALREQEEHLRAVVDNILEGIVTFDQQKIIRTVNHAAKTILGGQDHEIVGKKISDFVDESSLESFEQLVQHAHAIDSFEEKNATLEIQGIHKNGTRFPMEILLSKMVVDEDIHYVGIVHDITERKKSEEIQDRQKKLLHALHEATSHFVASKDPKIIFDNMLNNLLKVTKSEYGFIGRVLYRDNGKRYLKIFTISDISWNEETRIFYKQNAAQGIEFTNFNTLFGYVVQTGQSIISNKPGQDPRRGGLPEGHPPLHSFLGVPIYSGENLVGMYGLANRPEGYDQSILDFLRPFESTCGTLIDAIRTNEERLKNHQALLDSEMRMRILMDSVVDGIITISEDGTIESFNPAAERIFEYTADEVIGQKVNILMPEPHHTDHSHYIQNYINTSQGKIIGMGGEVQGRKKDGTIFPLELGISEMWVDNHRVFSATLRDITERKKALEDLREIRERLELALQGADLGMWDWNLITGDVIFGQQWAKLLGCAPEDIIPHISSWESIIHPEDKPKVMEVLHAHLRGDIPTHESEHRIRTFSGNWKWVSVRGKVVARDSEGNPLRATGTYHDITARKIAEQNLRLLRERLELTLKGAELGLWDWNIATGDVYYDDQWAKILGYNRDELPQHISTWDSLIHPEDEEEVYKKLKESHKINTNTLFEVEYRSRKKSGDWIWILARGSVVERDRKGNPLRMIGTIQDLTARKTLQFQLLQAKEQAESANRAKSEFLAKMSHELRTPLNSIIGFSTILNKNKNNNLLEKDLLYLEKIQKNGVHLLGLINDILDLSKVEVGKMELQLSGIMLDRLIQETMDHLEPQVKDKDVVLETVFPAKIHEIQTDEAKFRQVLINLAGNAIKFTSQGYVQVELVTDEETHKPTHVHVVDTGIGISPEKLSTIFDAFHQADGNTTRKYGGTGLGLAISRSLCELMGYNLTVVSEVGQGSRFTIHLHSAEKEKTGES